MLFVCHPLLLPPGLPDVSTKRYSTGPLKSIPVVAVIIIALSLIAAGGELNVAGSGVGGLASGSVVADNGVVVSAVSLPRRSRIFTVYLKRVLGCKPVSV